MVSNLVDVLSQFLADGEAGVMREMKLATADRVPKFSFYGHDWDPVFDKVKLLYNNDDKVVVKSTYHVFWYLILCNLFFTIYIYFLYRYSIEC